MELTYTTPEALSEKQFTASRDPSFSDVRDYLIFPSTPMSATSDVSNCTNGFFNFNFFCSASVSTF